MDYKYETLGDNVLPSNYKIMLDLNMEKFEYEGNESIMVGIKKKTDTIKLNAKELEIMEASVEQSGKSFKAKVKKVESKEQIVLTLPQMMAIPFTVLLASTMIFGPFTLPKNAKNPSLVVSMYPSSTVLSNLTIHSEKSHTVYEWDDSGCFVI